jgi:hypothetical protein
MPYEVVGLKQTLKELRKFTPELRKSLDREIQMIMMPVRDRAKGFVPSEIHGLSSWSKSLKNPSESGPRTYRSFPTFNSNKAKSGIVYRKGFNKSNRAGFAVKYYVANTSDVGAIYETAGRKNPQGMKQFVKSQNTPKGYHHTSHDLGASNNPGAGKHFVDALGQLYDAKPRVAGQRGRSSRMHRGRLIFRAWAEMQNKVTPAVAKALERAVDDFNSRSRVA